MRGKPKICMFLSWTIRITPACAGKTTMNITEILELQDHPRVCGENATRTIPQFCPLGSPPRVRGKRFSLLTTLIAFRITPACAGKTSHRALQADPPEDHPRVCGENRPAKWESREKTGSPPRVRGKPSMIMHVILDIGITPACAGKTISLWILSNAR